MNRMILLIPLFGFLMSCEKEAVVETNFLLGKWKLIKTELFENDSLTGSVFSEELSTTYYFDRCDNKDQNFCDMYIEEDGEQETYSYVYNELNGTILLNESSLFSIEGMNSSQLKLSRSYDNFKSTYEFVKED